MRKETVNELLSSRAATVIEKRHRRFGQGIGTLCCKSGVLVKQLLEPGSAFVTYRGQDKSAFYNMWMKCFPYHVWS